jgi:hypothetical protein
LFRAKDNQEMNAWISKTREGVNSSGGQSAIDKTKSLPPPDKQQRSTSSLSGPGGPSASLKPFKK